MDAAREGDPLWHGMRRDALWQLAERGARVGLGFVLSVVIARALGPANFGVYSYALATVALFAFLGQAGLDALLMRELVRAPSRAALTLSEGFALRTAGAVFAALGSICASILAVSDQTRGAIPLVCILSLSGLLQAGWVVESLLLANRRFADVAVAKILAYVVSAGLRLAALLSPEPMTFLAAATVAESLLCLAGLWWMSHRRLSMRWSDLRRPDARHLMAMARMATPMLLSAFTIAVYSRVDVFMLGRMAGNEAAGLYTAGVMLSEGFYLIPTAVMAAAAPRLAQMYLRDVRAFDDELHRFIRRMSAVGLAIALMVTLVAPFVLPLLFGSHYAAASKILQIHIWSTWAVFVSTASDPYYINHDLRRFYLIKTSIAAILNVALNFLLIPRMGAEGAAYATLIAYASSAIVLGALSRRTRPLFGMQLRAIAGMPAGHPAQRSTRE